MLRPERLEHELGSLETVRDACTDERVARFMRRAILEEIVPTLSVPDAESFAREVLDRFANPYIRHSLIDITLKAKGTLRYHGKEATYMVIVDLGIPPGFTVDGGDFAEMVAAKKLQKFSITARQVTLYLGDVKPGDVLSFEYMLKAKYPVKAKTPATVAYEYYTPTNRVESKPVELTVVDKK